eukprot:SAG22_NODE_6471_length_850_cov_1.181092_1_plen_191_part_00
MAVTIGMTIGDKPARMLSAAVAILMLSCRLAAAAGAGGGEAGGAGAEPATATTQQVITIDARQRISRVSPLMVGSAVEYLNHQVYGFGLYAQMVYGESMEEPPVGLVPPGPPLPPPPAPAPPSPPGPACKVSALTNDSSILNHYCQTHAAVRTNGLCNIKCPGSGGCPGGPLPLQRLGADDQGAVWHGGR